MVGFYSLMCSWTQNLSIRAFVTCAGVSQDQSSLEANYIFSYGIWIPKNGMQAGSTEVSGN